MVDTNRGGNRQLALALDVGRRAECRDVDRDLAAHVHAEAAAWIPHAERVARAAAGFEAPEAVLVAAMERSAAVTVADFRRRRPVARVVADVAAIVHRQF